MNVFDRVRSEGFGDVRQRSKKEDVNERYSRNFLSNLFYIIQSLVV
jgi:hypothetical protein